MSIYPQSGVTIASGKADNAVDVNSNDQNKDLFYGCERCEARFDAPAANAMLSEISNLMNGSGREYDHDALDNVIWAISRYVGHVTPEHYGAVGDGVTDDTAAIVAAMAANDVVHGSGTYRIENMPVIGDGKTLDLSTATLVNNSATGEPMFDIGGGGTGTFRDGQLLIGTADCGVNAGELIKVTGSAARARVRWRYATVQNPLFSVLRAYSNEGAVVTGWTEFFAGFTRGTDVRQVPAIDMEADTNPQIQGNVLTFGYLYGSGYTGGTDSIPAISLRAINGAEIAHNSVDIHVGEKLDGGAVHLVGVSNSDIKAVGFDTGNWIGDFIRSTDGHNNVYRSQRKAGTRTAFDFGSGLVSPYDVRTIDDTNAVIYGSGRNGGAGRHFMHLGGYGLVFNTEFVTVDQYDHFRPVNTPGGVNRTIAAGTITVENEHHRVNTEALAATDDLDNITPGYDGQIVRLQTVSNGRDITLRSGVGNLRLAGSADFTLTRISDFITLSYNLPSNTWDEVARSDNQV